MEELMKELVGFLKAARVHFEILNGGERPVPIVAETPEAPAPRQEAARKPGRPRKTAETKAEPAEEAVTVGISTASLSVASPEVISEQESIALVYKAATDYVQADEDQDSRVKRQQIAKAYIAKAYAPATQIRELSHPQRLEFVAWLRAQNGKKEGAFA